MHGEDFEYMNKLLLLVQKPLGERCFQYVIDKCPGIIGAVVTNKSNNVWWKSNSVYEQCIEMDIPVIDNFERNEDSIIEAINDYDISNIVSVQHSWVLSNIVLNLIKGSAINIHCAKLPDYKGYLSYNHAILNDDKWYYVTAHDMTPEVDSGGIVNQRQFPILEDDTAYSLYKKALEVAYSVFVELIDSYENLGSLSRTPQVGQGCFYGKDSINSYRHVVSTDLSDIYRITRALYFPGFKGAYLLSNGKKIWLIPDAKTV